MYVDRMFSAFLRLFYYNLLFKALCMKIRVCYKKAKYYNYAWYQFDTASFKNKYIL